MPAPSMYLNFNRIALAATGKNSMFYGKVIAAWTKSYFHRAGVGAKFGFQFIRGFHKMKQMKLRTWLYVAVGLTTAAQGLMAGVWR